MIYVIVASIATGLLVVFACVILTITSVICASLIIDFFGKSFFERFENGLLMELWCSNHDWINSFPKLPVREKG